MPISGQDIRPGDWLILILYLLMLWWLMATLWWSTESETHNTPTHVLIQYRQQPAQIFSLHKDRKITLKGDVGPVVLEIKKGKIRFAHSHCFAQLCVLHGWISRPGEYNACLPNKISLSIPGTGIFDAINF